uniref:Beta-defensin n=1 Tax=Catagonus wagneri TaxID=51154 RepID=A0A8C3WJ80_9CETA
QPPYEMCKSTFVFLMELTSAPTYGGGKKCWHSTGNCRKNCNAGEVIKAVCTNHQSCCIPRRRMSTTKDAVTSRTTTYGLRENYTDVIVTVESATTNWK